MISKLNHYIRGFIYFFMGFQLLREPKLLRFVWVPLCCNILLFTLMFIFALQGLKEFSYWVVHFLPHWLQWLDWFVWLLGLVFSGIILLFISTLLVNIFAGPFNSFLSEKVVAYLQITDEIVTMPTIKALPAAFVRETKFLLYYLPRAIFFLILFMIPVVQIFAAVLWFLFNSWVFAMQFLDYPMDNYGISINRMKTLMQHRRMMCLGFGSAVTLFAMIPLVNFVIVPVAVIGATLFWANEFRG